MGARNEIDNKTIKGVATQLFGEKKQYVLVDLCNEDGMLDLVKDIDPIHFRLSQVGMDVKPGDLFEFSTECSDGALNLNYLLAPGYVRHTLGKRAWVKVIKNGSNE